MLELLQYESFRKELSNQNCSKFIEEQQLLHWQHYLRTRMKMIQEQADLANSSNTANVINANANNSIINSGVNSNDLINKIG